MNRGILKLIKNRKRLFVEEGGIRTAVWKEEKKRIDCIIRERKRGYMDTQRAHLLSDDAGRNFFKHVKNFATFDKPKQVDARMLLPGLSDLKVAERLAAYFNEVSNEFDPLQPHQIPRTKSNPLPRLHNHEVAKRIKSFRKPKSMVPGDIFPSLMTPFL